MYASRDPSSARPAQSQDVCGSEFALSVQSMDHGAHSKFRPTHPPAEGWVAAGSAREAATTVTAAVDWARVVVATATAAAGVAVAGKAGSHNSL